MSKFLSYDKTGNRKCAGDTLKGYMYLCPFKTAGLYIACHVFLLLSVENLSTIYVFGDTSKALNVQRFWRRKDRKSQCQQDIYFSLDMI